MNQQYPTYTVGRELPAWVRKGHTQYQNYHAGPSEVAKLVLTQFSLVGHTVEDLLSAGGAFAGDVTPSTIWDRTNKYSDEFLDEMQAHGKTLIQVNWSCGFSVEGEAVQRRILTDFARKAHERDMRICAYLSITNIFWKEAFEKEPFLKEWLAVYSDGSPHLYGNSKGRYLACVNRQEWIDYIKAKVKMVIDAGLDHIYFDNVFADCACSLCHAGFGDFTEGLVGQRHELPVIAPRETRGIYSEPDDEAKRAISEAEAYSREYLHKQYMAYRLTEALKDIRDYAFTLKSPLPFSANNHLYPFINDICNVLYSQDTRLPGPDWNNVDLLRYLAADSDGWKTVVTNHPVEDADPRFSMAEAMAFQSYPYGITHMPYNLFYRDHPELFTDVEPMAKIGVVMEWPRRRPNYLDPLAYGSLMYEAIVLQKWTKDQLSKYDAILLPDLEAVSDELVAALEEYSANGGTVIATGTSTLYDGLARPRERPLERAEAEVTPDSRLADDTVRSIREASDPQPIEVEGPSRVIANLVRKSDESAHLVHVVNYANAPAGPVRVRVNVPGETFTRATLFSPDPDAEQRDIELMDGGSFSLDNVDVYSIVRLT